MKIYKNGQFISPGSSIHPFKAPVTKNEEAHTHEFIEMVYILSGSMTHVIDGQRYSVSRGDILFMNYGCTHSFEVHDGVNSSYVNILFSPDSISDVISPSNTFSLLALASFNDMRSDSNYGIISFEGDERKAVESIVLNMLSEYKAKKQGFERIIENYLNILLTLMLRKNNAAIESREIDVMWRELLNYIDENLENKLTLSDLAKKCFYNPSYFSRIFKERFGVSLMEYILQKRLEQAADLLENTTLSVEQIGTSVGFSDRNSFHHSFARRYGIAPQQFRKSKTGKNT